MGRQEWSCRTAPPTKALGSRGITVNSVAPGIIDTDMNTFLPAVSEQTSGCATPSAGLRTPHSTGR
ncbi:hypothetical protein ACIRPQ_25375 [Streptomyces sp. NPDC101213]|uniref:hypothetical protein n=1 Tax=Streptomyces sp. NPDC101213 TaxID=3366130 RepID=UPI003825999A